MHLKTYWPAIVDRLRRLSRARPALTGGLRLELAERLYQYARLMRLHKPIGALLLLWPTLWALWIASQGRPDPFVLVVFIVGVVLMRSAGCVINDIADRNFDGHVARTRDRPLAAGIVSTREAWRLFLVLIALAFALVMLLNTLTILLAFAGAALAATYPFMKRYTYLPQFHLGVAFGWSIPMAFAAQTDAVPKVAWILFIANILWTVAYDTMYAMVDREDDRRIGVKSTAILFDENDRVIIGIIQLLMLAGMLMVGAQAKLGPAYYGGLSAATALGVYEQYLIRAREPTACFRAFLNNNWLGAAIFLGILIDAMVR